MIKNYFKIAWRNLRKNKLYSLINIFGLAVGIACCILVYLFVQDELSYDSFHPEENRIFRMERVVYESDQASKQQPSIFNVGSLEGVDKSAYLPLPLGPTLKENYPEVKHVVRYDEGDVLLRNGKTVFEEPVNYVESTFFEMFSFRLLKGNMKTVLEDKRSIVLTPAVAQKYFGEGNPVGQILHVKIRDEEHPYTVTGVAEAPPHNSSIQYGVLLPITNKPFYDRNIERWGSFNTAHFVQLGDGADVSLFKEKLDAFVAERYKNTIEKIRTRNNMSADAKALEFTLTPISDIHLDAAVVWTDVSNPLYTYILSGIAFLILIIACINYISLTLARSSSRTREVGIRKTVGAHRRQVASQFFAETMLLTFLALIAGIGLAELLLPLFNEISGKELVIYYLKDDSFLLIITGLTILVGFIAGSYPALFLSRFNPSEVIKGQSTYQFKSKLTKGLMVFQYSLSVFLIISSVVMYRQLDYVSQKELGYDEEQIAVVPTHTGWTEEGTNLMQNYREALKAVPEVVNVSGMAPAFTTGSNMYGFKSKGEDKFSFIYYVDHQFVETMGMELLAGRSFSAERPLDIKNSVVVNQALVESMGWEKPIGQLLPWKDQENPSTVIGVVKNFHFQSLEAEIQPMLFHMDPDHGGVSDIMVKIKPGQIASALPVMESAWEEVAPFTPFDYWFLDYAVANQYASYKQWMKIVAYSTAIAILIACLGLFGLAGITAVNKTKEIGIRKVLGAGIDQIILLLNKDIVKLIGFSLVLATPVSWYIMQQWLADFAYHIDIGVGIFVISAATALLIAVVTVSYHSIKAATINPADSLRSE